MIKYEEFKAYLNRDFWRSFDRLPFAIKIPNKEKFIKQVYLSILNKTYHPLPPIRNIDIDKDNGVTRTVPVFDIKDYCIYYFCIKILEPYIAVNRTVNTFGGWTLGGTIRKSEEEELESQTEEIEEIFGASAGAYSFDPRAYARVYGDFNSKLYSTARFFEDNWVVELDVANFYDSIRLDLLENKIRQVTGPKESEIVSLLFHFLNYWNKEINFYNKQTVGLPQDALGDCSRILANFYLQEYDSFIKHKINEKGGDYFRYADDQFFFAKDKNEAEKFVYIASKKLNCFGLSINQKKVNYRSTKELIKYRSFAIFDILSAKDAKNDREAIKLFANEYIKLRKSGIEKTKGRGLPILNKLLFCKISLLPISKRKKIIADFLKDEYLKKAKSDKLVYIYSHLPPKERKKFIKKLLSLSSRIYHNSYHLELIKFFKSKKIDSKIIKDRIKELDSIYKN